MTNVNSKANKARRGGLSLAAVLGHICNPQHCIGMIMFVLMVLDVCTCTKPTWWLRLGRFDEKALACQLGWEKMHACHSLSYQEQRGEILMPNIWARNKTYITYIIGLGYCKGHHGLYPKTVRRGCWKCPFHPILGLDRTCHSATNDAKQQSLEPRALGRGGLRTTYGKTPSKTKRKLEGRNKVYSSYCPYRGLYITCMYTHVSTCS